MLTKHKEFKYGKSFHQKCSMSTHSKLQNNVKNGDLTSWNNYLSPQVTAQMWKDEDYITLLKLHRKHKNHWKNISPNFKGRTDNCVKNQFFSILQKCLRKLSKFFDIFEDGISVNEVKPKVLTEFLSTNIGIEKSEYKNDETVLETIRDLVEIFFEMKMEENDLKINSMQVEKIKQAFKRLFKMK